MFFTLDSPELYAIIYRIAETIYGWVNDLSFELSSDYLFQVDYGFIGETTVFFTMLFLFILNYVVIYVLYKFVIWLYHLFLGR